MPKVALPLVAALTLALVASVSADASGGVNSAPSTITARGVLVGHVRLAGGPPSAVGKGGGLVTVLNFRGRTVARQRVKYGHPYRFSLASGRYRLGLGTHPRRGQLGGCHVPVLSIRSGHTTHKDLWFGCNYL